MPRSVLVRIVSAVVVGAAMLVPGAPKADALGAQSDSFDLSWSSTVPSLHTCLYYTLTGTVKYTTVKQSIYYGGATHTQWIISEPTVKAPKLVVTAKAYSSYSGCYGSGITLDGLTVAQHWTGYSCSLNPSISVGVPFSVGVGFWPTCSNRNQATYSSSYGSTKKSYTQLNSSSYVRFNSVSDVDSTPAAPCYGAFVSATPVQDSGDGEVSDSVRTSAKKVCLSPSW